MSIISEVKQRTDIVEVISDYVTLQKAGRNFKALCPFHSEKHPSFFVFPEQQTWHCFGACATGGDVFSFIMRREGIDFSEALHLLAQRAGITLSPPDTSTKAESQERENLFQINEAAAEYYHHLLLNTKAGEPARDYLSKRKVAAETIKSFQLGFSPDNWEALKNFLDTRGYKEEQLSEVGLIIEKEGGGSYDRFRNRLMFPIRNMQGRVIGFGARVLDQSQPKYTNSPQTPVFDKSSCLYGIENAKNAIRRENLIIIVEGYMDVLRAHQRGWQNVVASMGTSLTEKQVNIAKRLSKNIALALDADMAGEKATLRSAEVLAQSLDKRVMPMPTWTGLVRYENALDTEIRVVPLPQGKDPDEVLEEDPELWQRLVEQAPPMIDFAFQTVIGKADLDKAQDKSLAIQKLLPLIGEIKDPIRQAHYEQRLARLLKVSESTLAAAMRRSQPRTRRSRLTDAIERPRLAHQLSSSPIEEYCLALLFQHPSLYQIAQELSEEHFENTENRELFTRWRVSRDISQARQKLDNNLLDHLDYLGNKPFPPDIQEKEETRRLAMAECVLRLQERLSKRLESRKEAILNLEREKDGVDAEVAELEKRGIETSQQLQEIFVKQRERHREKRTK